MTNDDLRAQLEALQMTLAPTPHRPKEDEMVDKLKAMFGIKDV